LARSHGSAPAFSNTIYDAFDFFGSIGSDLAKTPTPLKTFGWIGRISSPSHQLLHCGRVCSIKFAYKPILTVLEERRQRIADGLANADKIKAGTGPHRSHAQEVLDKANAQANKLIEEARAAAARVQEQETQKAIAQAEQIIAKAREAAASNAPAC
jgi:hypothetical protein